MPVVLLWQPHGQTCGASPSVLPLHLVAIPVLSSQGSRVHPGHHLQVTGPIGHISPGTRRIIAESHISCLIHTVVWARIFTAALLVRAKKKIIANPHVQQKGNGQLLYIRVNKYSATILKVKYMVYMCAQKKGSLLSKSNKL